jgi:glucose-6-phosphate 1-epimerase
VSEYRNAEDADMTEKSFTVDLPDSVQLVEGSSGLSLLRVSTRIVTGELYLQGAHVSAWTPAGESAVIWMSKASMFAPAQPLRGGVPICFPWFGPGRGSSMSPVHGYARLAEWSVLSAEDVDGTVNLVLVLTGADVAGLPGVEKWQHPFELTYRVSFGAELAVALTVRNTGTEEFDFEEALHTYIRVEDIRRVRIEGLDGSQYLDRAPGGAKERVTQEGAATFTAETDRLYYSASPASAIDVAAGRRISVTKDGSANTVVWNPWIAKASAMPDYGDDEWREMVCLEAANALEDAITLDPAAEHTMSARYSVDHGT